MAVETRAEADLAQGRQGDLVERARGAVPPASAPRASLGAPHSGPLRSWTPSRRFARLRRDPRPPCRRARDRPESGPARSRGPHSVAGWVALRHRVATALCRSNAHHGRQPSRTTEQLRRPRRRARAGKRGRPLEPPGDPDRPRRRRQDPFGDRGGGPLCGSDSPAERGWSSSPASPILKGSPPPLRPPSPQSVRSCRRSASRITGGAHRAPPRRAVPSRHSR